MSYYSHCPLGIRFAFWLKQTPHSIHIVFRLWHLDDIAIIVNVLALLLQNESPVSSEKSFVLALQISLYHPKHPYSLVKLIQDAIESEKFNAAPVTARIAAQHFGNKICSDLLRLGSEHPEGELPQLGGGVLQQ